MMCSRSGKISYNTASKVTHNANECVKVINDEVQLQCNCKTVAITVKDRTLL